MALFGGQKALVGLDIGSAMIKAVVLQRKQGVVSLKRAAAASTPAGVLTEGQITDGITVARSVKSMFSDYAVMDRKVAAAVGGDQILAQADAIPPTRIDDAEAYVRERVGSLASFPTASAYVSFQPIDTLMHGTVLWAAAAAESVDWMRETVALTGRSAQAIVPQACALANTYAFNYEPSDMASAVLLNIGARHITLALVRGWALIYSRDIVIAPDWFSAEEKLSRRVTRALDDHWAQVLHAAGEYPPSIVYLSGGACGSPDLVVAVKERTSLDAENLNPFRRIEYQPGSRAGTLIEQHGPALAIAAGLALQGFEDL